VVTTPETIVPEITALLRRYMAATNGQRNHTATVMLHEVAERVVALRSCFRRSDGRTDWSGRTPEYRQAIREAYDGADVPHDYRDTLQGALRYHVGNLMRSRAPQADLVAMGFGPLAPHDRLALNTERTHALAALAGGLSGMRDPGTLANHLRALLGAVEPEHIRALDTEQAAALRASIDRLSLMLSEDRS
jgi:hypothetical protein